MRDETWQMRDTRLVCFGRSLRMNLTHLLLLWFLDSRTMGCFCSNLMLIIIYYTLPRILSLHAWNHTFCPIFRKKTLEGGGGWRRRGPSMTQKALFLMYVPYKKAWIWSDRVPQILGSPGNCAFTVCKMRVCRNWGVYVRCGRRYLILGSCTIHGWSQMIRQVSRKFSTTLPITHCEVYRYRVVHYCIVNVRPGKNREKEHGGPHPARV